MIFKTVVNKKKKWRSVIVWSRRAGGGGELHCFLSGDVVYFSCSNKHSAVKNTNRSADAECVKLSTSEIDRLMCPPSTRIKHEGLNCVFQTGWLCALQIPITKQENKIRRKSLLTVVFLLLFLSEWTGWDSVRHVMLVIRFTYCWNSCKHISFLTLSQMLLSL